MNVVLRNTTACGRFPALHDPTDRNPLATHPTDGATQSTSIVYLIHNDQQLQDRVAEMVETTGISVRGAESVKEFIDTYDDGHDGCLITDLKLRETTGLELLRTIEDQSIFVPSIFVTSAADVKSAIEVMRFGAVTVLETPFHDDELRDAIDEALRRDALARNMNLRRHTIRTHLKTLSDKERIVMEFVVEGMANKVIAKRLGVSIRTVESRRHAVFQKMEVKSLAQLVRYVVESEDNGF